MSYSLETKNQFIELRAQGFTLDTISQQIGVPKPTLGRWNADCLPQIQRLRALHWDLLEERIGQRLEDSLQRVAERLRKWEDSLDQRRPELQKPKEVMRIIRESRRDYLQLRSILLAPLQPSRGRAACVADLDPQKRDKTRQDMDSFDTTPLPQNDLQQTATSLSHSATPELRAEEPGENDDPKLGQHEGELPSAHSALTPPPTPDSAPAPQPLCVQNPSHPPTSSPAHPQSPQPPTPDSIDAQRQIAANNGIHLGKCYFPAMSIDALNSQERAAP
jgi:hypothetical protein